MPLRPGHPRSSQRCHLRSRLQVGGHFCVSRCLCVCVAGGVVAPEPLQSRHTCTQFQGNHALLKSLVGAPRRRRIIPSSCVLLVLMCILLCPVASCASIDIYLICSSCRFQPASTFPALPAAPPASTLLLSLPFRRHLTCASRRSASTYPVSVPCRSSQYLTLLLPLPVPAGPYLFYTSCDPRGIHSSCINKLCLNSVKSCLSLLWGPNLN